MMAALPPRPFLEEGASLPGHLLLKLPPAFCGLDACPPAPALLFVPPGSACGVPRVSRRQTRVHAPGPAPTPSPALPPSPAGVVLVLRPW